jgi:hypothetical protein
MSKPESHPQTQKPTQNLKPQEVNVQLAALKPNKNVSVPKYDLLTEGYDPAKLKKRQ